MSVRTFGKYEVLARLATGGAASIFLARQPGAAGFHKLVCLKTLLPGRAADEDFVAMFLDEARLAARLNHPSCVQIYDLGRVRGVYYISMEYILGETLWNLLSTVRRTRTALPSNDVAAIVAAACDGLHHAHELRDAHGRPYHLVHRDVSPQNIMVSFQGETKLVDFGIAKAETGRAPTNAGLVKGKFSYMSPEQIAGGDVDRRSDIFSLGIVLFECLASRRLFRADSPEEIARLILEHRAPRLSEVVEDIPPALDEVCARALQPRLGKRFQTALEMGNALRAHLDAIRYQHGTSRIARLCEERFGDLIPRRRQALELAYERPSVDSGELLEAFGAGAVREVDLFPHDVPEPSPDFSESPVASGVPEPSMTVPDPAELGRSPSASLLRAELEPEATEATVGEEPKPAVPLGGSGFRVELEDARERPDSIHLGPIGALSAEEAGTTRTQIIPTRSDVAPVPAVTGMEDAPLLDPERLGLHERAETIESPYGPELDDDAPLPVVSGSPVPRRVAAPTPAPLLENRTPPVVVAPVGVSDPRDLRFGLGTVLAALAFGLAFGLVGGMVLTRWMFVPGP